jgi:hypothetical protein
MLARVRQAKEAAIPVSQEELVNAYLGGNLSRRTFIRRLVAGGLSLSTAVAYAHSLRPSTARATHTPGNDMYTAAQPPRVQTTAVTSISDGDGTVRLNGRINPRGALPTKWFFKVGHVGRADRIWTPERQITGGPKFDFRSVSEPLTGLLPGQEYFARLRADNGHGGHTNGNDVTFVAPGPGLVAITDEAVQGTTDNTAILRARITTNDLDTEYYFRVGEFGGQSWLYSSETRTLPGSTEEEVPVSIPLSGLPVGQVLTSQLRAYNGQQWKLGDLVRFQLNQADNTGPLIEVRSLVASIRRVLRKRKLVLGVVSDEHANVSLSAVTLNRGQVVEIGRTEAAVIPDVLDQTVGVPLNRRGRRLLAKRRRQGKDANVTVNTEATDPAGNTSTFRFDFKLNA